MLTVKIGPETKSRLVRWLGGMEQPTNVVSAVVPAVTIVVVLAITACTETVPPEVRFPDARGSYVGVWEVETSSVVQIGNACSEDLNISVSGMKAKCDGDISILSQTEDNLSGTFQIQRGPFGDLAGGVGGMVDEDGNISLSLSIPPADVGQFERLSGCSSVTGAEAFTGSLDLDTLTITASVVGTCTSLLDSSVVSTAWTFRFVGGDTTSS